MRCTCLPRSSAEPLVTFTHLSPHLSFRSRRHIEWLLGQSHRDRSPCSTLLATLRGFAKNAALPIHHLESKLLKAAAQLLKVGRGLEKASKRVNVRRLSNGQSECK